MRRRLGWAGGALVAAATATAVILLMPTGKPLPPQTTSAGPTIRQERQIKLTPAMRREIDATLERFVPAAVARRDPTLAWRLAGPGLRGGTSRADWAAGDLPVFPFPVRDSSFRGWKPVYTYRDRVAFDLLLHAKPETRLGPLAISVDVVRRDGRWLVDAWYPAAVFTGPDDRPWVTGSPDFTPDGYTSAAYNRPKFAEGRLDPVWFALPAGIVGSAVLGLGVFGLVVLRRNRRAYADYFRR